MKSLLNPKYSLRRRGIVIPIVIGILTVFSILLLALSQSGTEVYRSTSLMNHRMHARFMNLAAVEEMHDILWNRLSNPQKATKLRENVINAVIGGGEFELDLLSDMKYAVKIYRGQDKGTKENKSKAKVQIYEATAKFHNFKQIVYSVGDVYRNPVAFYRSPDGGAGGAAAAGQGGTHPDWYGFVTYTIKSQHGIVSKSMFQTRGMKIVDMTPLGKEYAVFEMEPTQGKSLNEGPGFYINGNQDGRIRLIGPYYLDVEGKSDGLAKGSGAFSFDNNKSVDSKSYPNFAGNKWTDDAWVPTPKWNTACPWFSYDPGPRIAMKSGGSGAFMYCVPLPCCPHPISIPVDYPAQFLQPQSQEWISSKIDKGEQNFSLMGDPSHDGEVQFKGIMYSDGAAYEEAQGVTEDWNPDQKMEIRHEGVIIGNYKTHSVKAMRVPFTTPCGYCNCYFCAYFWMGKKGQDIQQYYAFKGDEEPEVDWMSTIIGGLMDMAGAYAMGSGFAGASGMQVAGAIAKGVGQSLMMNAMNMMNSPGLQTGAVPSAESIPNVFPSGFRMISRAAGRHYANMDQALWKKKNLLLDGVYWVDDMNTKKDIKYIGKGTLAFFGAEFNQPAKIKRFEPMDESKDWLNLWYMHLGGDSALKVDTDYIMAGVFSRGSVNPQKPLVIIGNYMTSSINKELMDSDMVVTYWNEKLSEIEEEDFKKDYRIISMSPKVEALSELPPKITAGIGDDGVQVIIPTIGN